MGNISLLITDLSPLSVLNNVTGIMVCIVMLCMFLCNLCTCAVQALSQRKLYNSKPGAHQIDDPVVSF